ncbi:MAG TPA: hypothetical protein VEY50_11730 [Lysobacter sp.]|nr:hypothetical protein [Lysobacter sp.]
MRLLTACLLLTLAIAPAAAQDAYVPIEQRLSAEQLRETGLDALSPDQLRRLNQILRDEQAGVAQRAKAEAAREQNDRVGLLDRDTREPIESSIVGRFRGWSGGERLTLANGQTWQVLDTPPLVLRGSLENPKVVISPGFMGAWYLTVEGQSPKAKVRRIK